MESALTYKILTVVTFLTATTVLPITGTILTYFLMIGIDTILGRIDVKKTALRKGKVPREELKSRLTKSGFLSKLVIYLFAISFTFVFDYLIIDVLVFYYKEDFPIHYATTVGLSMIFIAFEFDSIDEHIYSLKGITIRSMVKKKIKQLKEVVLNVFKLKKEIQE